MNDAGYSVQNTLNEFWYYTYFCKSTLYNIKKEKMSNIVLKQDTLIMSTVRRKTTLAKFHNIDVAVCTWYKQHRSVGVPVRDVEVQVAAETFTQKLEKPNFKPSIGRPFKFWQWHYIVN